jgi:hypothetical protein
MPDRRESRLDLKLLTVVSFTITRPGIAADAMRTRTASDQSMFYGKQIATFAAAIALLVGTYRLLHVPPVTAQIHYTYWKGSTADDSDQSHQHHSSNLCISEPDPTTKKVTATKDTLQCDGSVDGGHLALKCQQDVTLIGFLPERSSYKGAWTLGAAAGGQSTGTFDYSYIQDDACPVVSK